MTTEGLLLVDKLPNKSSNYCLGRIKYGLGIKKCGYAGTLDPFATGLLVIGCNGGTELLNHVLNLDKEYEFRVKFGAETNTGDINGRVIASTEAAILPTIKDINTIIESNFIGFIEQTPPVYSALKVSGARLCDIARKEIGDIDVFALAEAKRRIVKISRFQLINRVTPDTFDFKVSCSKGTYIRKLTIDLGGSLGFYANTISLRRTRIGPFSLSSGEFPVLNTIVNGLDFEANSISHNDLIIPKESCLKLMGCVFANA